MWTRRRASEREPRASWIGRVKQRSADNRGLAVVEAAFVTPVFFILVFGVLEIGLAMNDYLAVASTVRAGSRAASASGNDQKADLYTVLGISREASAIDRRNIVRVVIYKPAGFGQEPTAACKNGTSQVGVCNVYTTTDFTNAETQVKEETQALAQNRPVDQAKVFFGCKTTSPDRYWCPTTRKVTLAGTGPEYVGVWMKIDHPWITNSGVKTLTDQSVIRLEPRVE